jgi:hypothetical protein
MSAISKQQATLPGRNWLAQCCRYSASIAVTLQSNWELRTRVSADCAILPTQFVNPSSPGCQEQCRESMQNPSEHTVAATVERVFSGTRRHTIVISGAPVAGRWVAATPRNVLSPYHFARAFKQSFGTPPHRHHMSHRMDRAKEMLEVPARTAEIGLILGFAETSSFTTSFRRSVGVTPSDYRRGVA